MVVLLKVKKSQIKTYKPILILLLFAIFTTGINVTKEFNCMKNHYPEKFTEVYMMTYPDKSDDDYYSSKGKAVYPRYYIYDGVRYGTKITKAEFDDRFFVCEDDPSQEYSESDLNDVFGDFVIYMIILFVWLVGCIIMLLKPYPHPKKEE